VNLNERSGNRNHRKLKLADFFC